MTERVRRRRRAHPLGAAAFLRDRRYAGASLPFARDARERLEGVPAYAATISAAIGQALALADDGDQTGARRPARRPFPHRALR